LKEARRSKAEESILYYDALLYDSMLMDSRRLQILARETNSWATTGAKRMRDGVIKRRQDTSLQRQILRQVAARAGIDLPGSYPGRNKEGLIDA
jgi:hypothetical protein